MTHNSIYLQDKKWKKIGGKVGGANVSGVLGGIYKNKTTGVSALIKKEPKVQFNISEFLGGAMMYAISPKQTPKIDLVSLDKNIKTPNSGDDIYIKSQLFNNYTDLHKDIYNHLPTHQKQLKFFQKDGRPLAMGTREKLFKTYTKAFSKLDYQNFAKATVPSLLIGDVDIHPGNYGVIREKSQSPKLVRIDFGWAFGKLTDKIHPHSASRHLPFIGPTNHFREFPKSLKLNHQFAEELFRTANLPLKPCIDKSFAQLQKYYDINALRAWAKHSMPKQYKKDLTFEQIKNNFSKIMSNRQEFLKEYGIEIKLGLLLDKKNNKYYITDKKAFKKLVQENSNYFKDIILENKKIRFRDKSLDKNAKHLIKDELLSLAANNIATKKYTTLSHISKNNKVKIKNMKNFEYINVKIPKVVYPYLEELKKKIAKAQSTESAVMKRNIKASSKTISH